METNTAVADQNTERLIQAAYQPEPAPAEFAASLAMKMTETAKVLAHKQPKPQDEHSNSWGLRGWRRVALLIGGMAACVLMLVALSRQRPGEEKSNPVQPDHAKQQEPAQKKADGDAPPIVPLAKWTDDVRDGMMPRIRPAAPALPILKEGKKLTTKAGQRRLVQLSDGTRLYINEKTEVEAVSARQLTLHSGQIYLEVAPAREGGAPAEPAPRENGSVGASPSRPAAGKSFFVVKTANRELTATGTHFAVQADSAAAGLVVTQGKVAVKGIDKEVTAGQQIAAGESEVSIAPRATHTLAWTRDLMAAAETPMVPACQHAGGELIALDPQGQEIKLSLRKYDVDVHIEDGFARTTIDQTYFNTTWERLEGTFYFPLPADASLSRLAMYVTDANNQCKLMEGGMAERKHAADVYETIRYMRRDPALLEWLDGSTFKMRVFPLEAKQEKRIILSYTQKLPSLYGTTRYRFTGGVNMPVVREWSFNARIKSGAGMTVWSPTVPDAMILPQGGDTLVRHFANNIKPAADVTIAMKDKTAIAENDVPRFAATLADNQQYLMLRYRPTLPNLPERQRRDWIVLFESSAQRDPIVAGTQVDILRNLLKNAEYDDTFVVLTANSKVRIYDGEPSRVSGRVPSDALPDPLRGSARPATPQNVAAAIKFLESAHLVGALDLEQGLQTALKFAKDAKNPHIVHIGSGIPAMGQRDAGKLAKMLPEHVPYVGVGVGKRWNRAFMKAAAERTNGLFTQINPDEVVAWRAFELLATLNTPRLLDVQILDANSGEAQFLSETTMIAQGEEICALTRVPTNKGGVPGKIVIKGTLAGKPFVKECQVANVLGGAGYLPRIWAKLEIDRLLAADSAKHKDAIISLSKAMYVISPFTSLLVLETDADYERFKVDRGRKDHWAMYQCPPKIPQVYEPDGKAPPIEPKKDVRKEKKPAVEDVAGTIVSPAIERAIYKDILVKVAETRTGSLMLGAGINSDNGFVGSLVLSPPGGKYVADDESSARAGEVFIVGNSVTQDRIIRRHPPSTFVGSKAAALSGTDAIPGVPRLSGIDWTLSDQRIVKDISRGELGEILLDKKQLEDRLILRDVANITAYTGWRGYKAEVKRSQAVTFEDLKIAEANLARLDLFAFDPERKSKGDVADQPLARVGEVYIVGNNVTQDRVIRGQLQGRTQFAPVLVSPTMEWGVPRTIVSVLASEARLTGNEEFGSEIGLHMPVLFNRGKAFNFNSGSARNASESKTTESESLSFLYQRPTFEYDRTLFTDLLQYAPGLHTAWADVLATLEEEADVAAPKLGNIDSAARKLIDKARSTDWQTLTIAAHGPIPGYKIHFNGIGQFTYERILGSGLSEKVVCDGKTLYHLYPELGLASKRAFSRHHHGLIEAIHPAFLPPVEDLARGCDVKAIDASTVAITCSPRPGTPGRGAGGEGPSTSVHLVFAKDGRLSERCAVHGGKTLLRQIFHVDGGIEWQDAEGKTVAKRTPPHPRPLSPGGERGGKAAPNLQVDVNELVVINLPIRTPEHINALAKKRDVDPDRDVGVMSERFIAACFMGDPADRQNTLVHLFVTPANRKLGHYVLLNSVGAELVAVNTVGENIVSRIAGKKWLRLDPEKEHPHSALAMLITQVQRERTAKDNSLLRAMPGPKDGFIQKLGRFRDLWLTWHNQRPTQNVAAMPMYKAKVLEFLQETTSPLFAHAILDTMQRRCNIAPSDRMTELAVKRFGPITSPAGLGYVFRYEEARSVYQAGLTADAGKQFRTLFADTLKLGMLPPIDADFRAAVQPKEFIGFIRASADGLIEKKRFGLAFQLAAQMDQLGDEALCDEVLAAILAKASDKERNAVTLVCVQFQAQRKNFAQADRLLGKLLDDKELAKVPQLWRGRSALAKQLGQTAESVRCLEKALDLEYAELPEIVNLESIRADYRLLLEHYQRIAEASASLEKSAPKAFLAKVIRTADRWRLVDPEASEPCKLAGKILQTAGARDLAWDYWTTPIDLHPAESKPWVELAETLQSEGDLERADRAFALGFEAEPTDPGILWKRAQNLARLGQPEQARTLYRQIADGSWQDRFNATVEQARGLAGK